MPIVDCLLLAVFWGASCGLPPELACGPGLPSGSPITSPAPGVQDDDDGDDDEEEGDDTKEIEFRTDVMAGITRVTFGDATFAGDTFWVTWGDPEKFYQDVEFYGKNKSRHTLFAPGWLRLRGPARTPLEGKVCFSGNTRGSLLLRPRFEGPVELEAKVYFSLIENKPSSSFILSLHHDKREFWGVDFGAHIVQGRGKKRPRYTRSSQAAYGSIPARWVDRTALHTIKLRYLPEEKKVEAWHNERRVNTVEFEDGPEKGQIGIRWLGTKFSLIQLVVKGRLDREWVEKALKKKRVEREAPGPG